MTPHEESVCSTVRRSGSVSGFLQSVSYFIRTGTDCLTDATLLSQWQNSREVFTHPQLAKPDSCHVCLTKKKVTTDVTTFEFRDYIFFRLTREKQQIFEHTYFLWFDSLWVVRYLRVSFNKTKHNMNQTKLKNYSLLII